MKLSFLLFLSFLNIWAFAAPYNNTQINAEDIYQKFNITPSLEKTFITLGKDSFTAQKNSLLARGLVFPLLHNEQASLIQVDVAALPAIGEVNHEKFNRCAGFIQHNSFAEALSYLEQKPTAAILSDYSISQKDLINNLIDQVDEARIKETIVKLSSFNNRYFQSETGVAAAEWIAEAAKNLTKHRSDVSVELFKHSKWIQPSVIVTIKGTSTDKIIIGGHLDSINSNPMEWGSKKNKLAPGADDNASGIATWLEVLRILMDNNYKPKMTLQFMGYAAEEVGLRGSKEIAQQYAKNKSRVLGVMQLDMTNYKGSAKDIYLMTDFTNKKQNEFLGNLIDTYVKVPWGFDQCGYACSDHASWHNAGYAASTPFESTMKDMNPTIHSSEDILSVSKDNTIHAVNFVKLALAFAVELDQ